MAYNDYMPRYARQTILFEVGIEGQKRLAASSVLIVGVGGLGSPVALYLAAAGVGRLGLADGDVVSESNLQRQVLYDTKSVGLSKVSCAARRLSDLNPEVKIDTYDLMLNPADMARIVPEYDIVVDCTDNYKSRFEIDQACADAGVPWIYGSIAGFEGRVSLFGGKKQMRFGDLYTEREQLCAMPVGTAGVVGMTPGVVGNIQAVEVLKWLVGMPSPLDGALLTVDLLTYSFNIIDL